MKKRAQVAAEVSPFIIKAAQHIRDKQKILEEMIMTNDGRMRKQIHFTVNINYKVWKRIPLIKGDPFLHVNEEFR